MGSGFSKTAALHPNISCEEGKSQVVLQILRPFLIIAKIKDVVYKLQLPPHFQVHPVFHVLQLRRCFGPGVDISQIHPNTCDVLVVLVVVLQQRSWKKQGSMVEQVRGRWLDPSVLADTWEDKLNLYNRFPDAQAWGQASSQEGRDVNSGERRDRHAAHGNSTRGVRGQSGPWLLAHLPTPLNRGEPHEEVAKGTLTQKAMASYLSLTYFRSQFM